MVNKLLQQEKLRAGHRDVKPFFDEEKRIVIANAVKSGHRRIILDGRSFDIKIKKDKPKYVFVSDAINPISGASACLNRDELARLLK